MTAPEIPIGKRVALVRAAIARIEAAKAERDRLVSIPGEEWASAQDEFVLARNEFGYEWQNVKAILEAYFV